MANELIKNLSFKSLNKFNDSYEYKDFFNCDFTETKLDGTIFEDCNFQNCVFSKTSLYKTKFINCQFDSCLLSNLVVNFDTEFINCNIKTVKLKYHLGILYNNFLEINCMKFPYKYWTKNYKNLGEEASLTPEESEEYYNKCITAFGMP